MTTIQERIEATLQRASNHYSLSYALRVGGEDVAFSAVKKLLPSDPASSPSGASIVVKRAELILTRTEYDAIVGRLGTASLKDAVVTELAYNGATNEWRVSSYEPFVENDPTGATVRISVYQRTKAQ